MTKWSSALWLAMLAAGLPTTAHARAGDRIYYLASGLMSDGVDLAINLEDGHFEFTERSFARGSAVVHRSGRIDRVQLDGLRETGREALVKGLRSARCVAEDKRVRRKGLIAVEMPSMDYHPSLFLTVDGRESAAPLNPGCWSGLARQLLDAALLVASSGGREDS